MKLSTRLGSVALCSLTLLGGAACAPPPPKPAAPVKAVAPPPATASEAPLAPEPPLPTLSARAPTRIDEPDAAQLTLTGRAIDGAFEVLELTLSPTDAQRFTERSVVEIEGPTLPYAFVASEDNLPNRPLWVRRPLSDQRRSLDGALYIASVWGDAGRRVRLHAELPNKNADPKVLGRYLAAATLHFQHRQGPFFAWAASTLSERLGKAAPQNNAHPTWGTRGDQFADLIATTTGRSSVQEALQQNRPLYLELSRGPRKTPITALEAPRLTRHPWPQMRALLPKRTVAPELLAAATPADFYYLRVRDFSTFLDLSQLAESWGTPALDVLDGKIQDRGLRDRYQTELALESGELSRVFGPSVIAELALVGSDPYLIEGSDLTLIFRVTSGPLFDAALLKALGAFGERHGGITSSELVHEGVTISVSRSSDGRVHRHRASVEGLQLVSNSAGALKRVISAVHGKAPRLADEPDFAYMLARDADKDAPLLAFAGDRFVETVVGPQQKIKAAERALALAELSRPGYAALLFGFLNGRSPKDAAELVQAKLLTAADLKPGGVAAGWQPGGVAQSARGSTLAMLPLIDTPDLTRVTAAEQSGYEEFARQYERDWSEFVDPFALRVSRTPAADGGMQVDAELRVLPLLRQQYRGFLRSVGDARIDAGGLPDGLRLLLGVGKDAELRHLLNGASRYLGDTPISFDWLGDYAYLGIADRNELAETALYQRDTAPEGQTRQADRMAEQLALGKTPLYGGIAIRSVGAAAIALTVLKHIGDEVTPGTLIWKQVRKHRGSTVMSVQSNEADKLDATVYYALTKRELVFSLNETVLLGLIDRIADGKNPREVAENERARATQLVLDLQAKQGGGLLTVLSWSLTKTLLQGQERARDSVLAAFRGAPELASDPEKSALLLQNYFGSVTLTPEGQRYGFGPDGVRDPVRGSASAPVFPALPVADSAVSKVIGRLKSLRSEVAFDDEPGNAQGGANPQSLRVHLSLGLR